MCVWATFFLINTLCKVRMKSQRNTLPVTLFHWEKYIFTRKDVIVEPFCVTDLRSQYRMNKKEDTFTRIFYVSSNGRPKIILS